MGTLVFNPDDFITKITDGIDSERSKIEAILKNKKNLSHKIAENDKKIQGLIMEEKLFLCADFKTQDDALKKRPGGWTDLNREKDALISKSGGLTNADLSCDNEFCLARERLVKEFQKAVRSYFIETRLPVIVKTIEDILEDDMSCLQTVSDFYKTVFHDTGIKLYDLVFDFQGFVSEFKLSDNQKEAMETIIKKMKNNMI